MSNEPFMQELDMIWRKAKQRHPEPTFTSTVGEDIEVDVFGDFEKAEKQWFNPIEGVGHPGSPASFTVNKVCITTDLGGNDIYSLLSKETIERLEEEGCIQCQEDL